MDQKHCSDERLLALMDGEAEAREASAITEHLEACWRCRARYDELRRRVGTVVDAVREAAWLPPGRIQDARERFHRRIAVAPPELASASGRGAGWFTGWGIRAAAVATAIGLGVAAFWHTPRVDTPAEAPAPKPSVRQWTPPLEAARPPVLIDAPRIEIPVLPRIAAEEAPPLAALLDAYAAAHRLGMCVREQLEINLLPNGLIRVKAAPRTGERRAMLLSALSETREPARFVIDIPSPEPAGGADGRALPPLSQHVSEASSGGEEIPLARELEAWLGPPHQPQRMRDYCHRVVTLSESLLAEAWALRRLAAAFPPGAVERLSPRDAIRLEAIVSGHLASSRFHATEFRSLAEPFLQQLPAAEYRVGEFSSGAWQASLMAHWEAARDANRAVLALFAVHLDSPPAVASSVGLLLNLLPRLEESSWRVQAGAAERAHNE